ncbi:glutamine synthetase [Streptomyces sp. SID12501]|uniref:glutamine synthetase n=1 Tax=Streptomyces sp. SID12501 TaxID=2706042 RepID=UPI001EF39BB3|nr:glutamine synthetase [Streptomyces sp. SID12501]
MTNNDQQRPSQRWSATRRHRSREAVPAPNKFLRNKRQEWEEYRSEVTAFELRKNLPVL